MSKSKTDDQPVTDVTPPDTLPTEHAGTAPTETADGIRWGAALPLSDGGVRLTAVYPDGLTATTDAESADVARKVLREYHQPRL